MDVIALLAAAAVATQDPKQETFVYDAWEAWSTFGQDSAVELATESAGGRTVVLRIIERRTADLVVIRVVRKTRVGDKEEEDSDLEQVAKPEADAAPRVETCRSCKKAHAKEVRQDRQKLTIDKRELECVLLESTVFDCAGRKTAKIRRWYHKDVPGWVVKQETVVDEMRTTTLCTRFDKR